MIKTCYEIYDVTDLDDEKELNELLERCDKKEHGFKLISTSLSSVIIGSRVHDRVLVVYEAEFAKMDWRKNEK